MKLTIMHSKLFAQDSGNGVYFQDWFIARLLEYERNDSNDDGHKTIEIETYDKPITLI